MCDDTPNTNYYNRTPAIFTAKIADFTHEDFTRNVNNVDIADLKIGPTNDTDHIFDVVFNAVWKRTIRQKGVKSLGTEFISLHTKSVTVLSFFLR